MKLIRRLLAPLALGVAALAGSSSFAAPLTTQLGFLWDESGSINDAQFTLMQNGYAAALAALPTDGSVEVTVFSFASLSAQIVAPTVINSVATRNAVVALINANTQSTGSTNMAAGITAIANAMKTSASYSAGLASIINIATDGVPDSNSDAVTAATAAEALGIDALTAEAIGAGANTGFLSNLVFSPLNGPCSGCGTVLVANSVPPNPMTSNPWVLPVNTFDDFGTAINAKVQAIVNPTPEPGILMLLALGMVGLGMTRRNKAA